MTRIDLLARHPHLSELLGGWAHREWYTARDVPLEAVVESYRRRANTDALPMAWVAFENDTPAGMVSLKDRDLWSRADIGPWLASLFVVPEFRNRGIGTQLAATVVAAARTLGITRLYLFRSHEWLDAFYLKRGWGFFEDCVDNDGLPAKIYLNDLAREIR